MAATTSAGTSGDAPLTAQQLLALHPFPEAWASEKRIERLWVFDVKGTPEALWPHLSDTSRMNRARSSCESRCFSERILMATRRFRPVSIALNTSPIDPDVAINRKEQRKMDRFILFAMVAAAEAIAQAGWTPADAQSLERTATVIASGIGGFPAIVDAVRTTDQRGIRRLSPFTVPSFLVNRVSDLLDLSYRIPALPFGLTLTGVHPTSDGLDVTVDAQNAVLGS